MLLLLSILHQKRILRAFQRTFALKYFWGDTFSYSLWSIFCILGFGFGWHKRILTTFFAHWYAVFLIFYVDNIFKHVECGVYYIEGIIYYMSRVYFVSVFCYVMGLTIGYYICDLICLCRQHILPCRGRGLLCRGYYSLYVESVFDYVKGLKMYVIMRAGFTMLRALFTMSGGGAILQCRHLPCRDHKLLCRRRNALCRSWSLLCRSHTLLCRERGGHISR